VLEIKLPKSPLTVERVSDQLLESAGTWLSDKLDGVRNPGVHLHLGLESDADLLFGHKLHLYAIAVADTFKAATGSQFSAVRVTKDYSLPTTLSAFSAVPASPPAATAVVNLTTRLSYAKPVYAKAVNDATQSIRDIAAGSGPLRLRVSYLTGLPRTWSRLWQPTIAGIFNPNRSTNSTGLDSSHVTELGFDHCSIGASLEHRVHLTVSASKALHSTYSRDIQCPAGD
jgi:hypothetical protein